MKKPQGTNLLLGLLPEAYRAQLLSRMKPVVLSHESVLYEPNETPKYAHFLTSGMLSIVTYMSDGAAAEVGIVGREGLVEAFHLLGSADVPTRGFMQLEGGALRMPFDELQREFEKSLPLRRLIMRFAQSQGLMVTQLAACNRLHEVEARLARWLLMVQDRVGNDVLPLTQEFLAQMLGAQRSTVTLAAGSLQRSGVIEYHRGRVQIPDRNKLQKAACECYPVMLKLFETFTQGLGSQSKDGAGKD